MRTPDDRLPSQLHDRALALVDKLAQVMGEMTIHRATSIDTTVAGLSRLHLDAFRRAIINHQAAADPEGYRRRLQESAEAARLARPDAAIGEPIDLTDPHS